MEEGVAEKPFSADCYFEDIFPYYLSIGMTYEQYWYGEPELTIYYRKAEEMRLKRDNYEMWLQGAYIKSALDSSIGTAFGRTRIDYVKKPYALTEEEVRKADEEERNERLEALKQSLLSAKRR